MLKKLPIRFAVLAALVLALAPTALAAKGGGGNGGGPATSSLELVLLDSTDGVPHWNQRVRFNVSTTATTQPHVSLKCYQSDTLVYSATTGYYDGYAWPWTQTMTLRSGAWSGGDADCTARLYKLADNARSTTLATLDFHVLA